MKQVNDNNSGKKTVGFGMTILILSVLFLMLTGESALAYSGGDYEISWYTIDGGGGTSSGGPYILTGTIGQPDADWSKGGKYELFGGFWPRGPLCVVEFDDFTRLAQLWLNIGSGLPADLDGDNDVDFDDLSWLAEFWLCNCPVPWPLK